MMDTENHLKTQSGHHSFFKENYDLKRKNENGCEN